MYLFTTLHIPLQRVLKLFFFSFYIELQISSVYIKTQQQPYSKSKKFRILFLRCINGRKLAKKKPTRFVLLNHYISWENKPRFLPRFMPHLIQNQSHKVPVVSAFSTILENCVKKLISFYISSFFKID